jgi:hypothetical protein
MTIVSPSITWVTTEVGAGGVGAAVVAGGSVLGGGGGAEVVGGWVGATVGGAGVVSEAVVGTSVVARVELAGASVVAACRLVAATLLVDYPAHAATATSSTIDAIARFIEIPFALPGSRSLGGRVVYESVGPGAPN